MLLLMTKQEYSNFRAMDKTKTTSEIINQCLEDSNLFLNYIYDVIYLEDRPTIRAFFSYARPSTKELIGKVSNNDIMFLIRNKYVQMQYMIEKGWAFNSSI